MKRDNRERFQFLEEWAKALRLYVAYAVYPNDRRGAEQSLRRNLILPNIEPINAPRVAGLAITVKSSAALIKRTLENQDYAVLRQSIPHDQVRGVGHEDGNPITGWMGNKLSVYWPWSDQYSEHDIHTEDLMNKVSNINVETEWIVGLGNSYKPVVFSIDPKKGSPHFFAIGSTTSGKSTAVVNMIAQLSRCESTRFVFIDTAKKGDGLGLVPYMKSAVGPPAWEMDDARAVLSWVLDEMAKRYRDSEYERGRLIVVIDEFPALRDDKFSVNAIDKIVSQGATCNIHAVLCAQHAIEKAIGAFSGLIKSNVSGRMAFKCGTDQNSIQAIGSDMATKLVPPGDCYAMHALLPQPLRIQASYFPDEWLKENLPLGDPVGEWPQSHFIKNDKRKGNGRGFTGAELGIALAAAKLDNGRPTLEKMLVGEGIKMGSTVSRDLLRVGKEMYRWLQDHKLDIVARR